jgi:hypothetical protein
MFQGTFMYFCVMSNLLVCLAWFNLNCHVVIHVCMYIWGTNLNGVGVYTVLVSMHVLLVSACSSVMLATKCSVQVKHDVSTGNKLLCHV